MNETFTISKEFLFKTNIYEITSISIEYNFDIDGSNLDGVFIISGDYRLHEISINKEDFSYKIPFTHEIPSDINLDTMEVEINDFTYDFKNGDELSVNIEYTITGEKEIIEFNDKEELNEFLNNNEAEVVDLSEDTLSTPEETDRVDIEDVVDKDINLDVNEINMPSANDDVKVDQQMFLNNLNKDDGFIKYHIHTVVMNDTLESICNKYKVNVNTLKKYNTFDSLELNMKLLIPEDEEN